METMDKVHRPKLGVYVNEETLLKLRREKAETNQSIGRILDRIVAEMPTSQPIRVR